MAPQKNSNSNLEINPYLEKPLSSYGVSCGAKIIYNIIQTLRREVKNNGTFPNMPDEMLFYYFYEIPRKEIKKYLKELKEKEIIK